MLTQCIPALRMLLAMTLLTGAVYPLAITGLSQLLFPRQAGGSLVFHGDKVVGSEWIAQKTAGEGLFWPRPSAVDHNPALSGGSNLGPTSKKLREDVAARRKTLAQAHGVSEDQVPSELTFASGSGLDPEISPAAARFQVNRVAIARKMTPSQADRLQGHISYLTRGATFGFLGEPRVNVLELNLALENMMRKEE